MSEQSPVVFSLWKELKKYLVINTEISNPRTANPSVIRETQFRNEPNEPIVDIKMYISNTAPLDDNSPLVVFTEVGLAVKDLKTDTYIGAPTHWLFDHPKNSVVDSMWHAKLSHEVIANPTSRYKGTTDDERNQGIILFPGGKLFFALTIPVSEIPKYKFYVEGNISLRHFSRINKPISIDV